MRWNPQEDKKLKKLYLTTKLTLAEIGFLLKHSPGSVNTRLQKLNIERRTNPAAKTPEKMSPALARIHAHVCGDGYMYKFQEKDNYSYWARYRKKKTRTRYIVGYCNNNVNLVREFQNDMYEIFGVRGKVAQKNKNTYIRINSKRIWVLLQKLGAGSSYSWRIPKEIINGQSEIQNSWIRAFFDDEAYFNDGGRIRVKCVNKKGLFQLAKMVNKFVPCHIRPRNGYYWGKTVCVNINKRDAPQFFSKIGSLRYQDVPGWNRKEVICNMRRNKYAQGNPNNRQRR